MGTGKMKAKNIRTVALGEVEMTQFQAERYVRAYFRTPKTEHLTASVYTPVGFVPAGFRLTVLRNRRMRVLTFAEPYELHCLTAALDKVVEELS